MDDVLGISPFFETPQPPRERDLTKDVEYEELDPVEEVQIDAFVSKQLVQANKEVLHSRRHEGLERDQIRNRVQIGNRTSHLPMHVLVTRGEDVWNLAALHPGHDDIVKLGLMFWPLEVSGYLHRKTR